MHAASSVQPYGQAGFGSHEPISTVEILESVLPLSSLIIIFSVGIHTSSVSTGVSKVNSKRVSSATGESVPPVNEKPNIVVEEVLIVKPFSAAIPPNAFVTTNIFGSTITYFEFSRIFLSFYEFSWIFSDFYGFLWIFGNFHEFS